MASNLLPTPTLTAATMRASNPFSLEKGRRRGAFSWKEDFGRPDTMIDALGAQRSLEVVSEPESSPESQSQPEPAKKSFMDEEVEFGKKEMAVSMVLGLVLGVVLFIVAPAFITNLIVGSTTRTPCCGTSWTACFAWACSCSTCG